MSADSSSGSCLISNSLDRRQVFKASAAMAATVPFFAAAGVGQAQPADAHPGKRLIQPGDVVLFQGDSITDAGRNRGAPDANSFAALGTGYAWLAAAQLLIDRPNDGLKIFNRGVSGNKVFQLADRWQADCLDLKPNVVSILIGVNDIWHTLNGEYDGTVAKYADDYQALVKRTRNALPEVRLVICEPFVLRCGAVNDKWFPEFDEYRAAARRQPMRPAPRLFLFSRCLMRPPSWRRRNIGPVTAFIPRRTGPR